MDDFRKNRQAWKNANNPRARLLTSSQQKGRQKKSKVWIFPLIMFLLAGFAYWHNGKFIDESTERPIAEGIPENNIIYDTIYSQLADHKTVITLISPVSVDDDTQTEQFHLVRDDHPEFFWLSGGGQWNIITVGTMRTSTFRANTICGMESVPAMEQELENVVSQLVQAADKESTDYGKALLIHDAIINLCTYDTETFYNDPDKATLSHTAYGCLVQRYAVCAGYAKAFHLIMNRLGIECGYISGTATDNMGSSGSHAWNCINLDGQYYYIDVTWDDPVTMNGSNVIRHDYFCLTAEEMGRDHFPDSDQKIY